MRSETPLTPDSGNRGGAGGVLETVAGRPPTDFDLVEQARRGDAAAFATLVRPHQEIAFRTAYLITRNAADAQDAAQDALLKAHRALRRFRRDAPFRPWFLTIVGNEARNRLRSSGRRDGLTLRAGLEQASLGFTAPSPEGAALAAEERAALLAAVERLPNEQRLAVTCRYFLDLSETETATVLGIRAGTVKSRLARGLERLRAEL
jgi:RNA polymerase sigma factor (sigma-70 family)